jgi:hypothetical protein
MLDYIEGRIGRGTVNYDNFDFISNLGYDAFQGFSNIPGTIISGYADR